jgi:repressor LexA
MSEPLTPLERRVYHYLIDFLAENTFQPSVREIGRRFRIKSTKSVADILQSLEVKGFVERKGGRSRGVRLVGFSSIGQTQPIPLYRRLNPGEPALSEEHFERYIAMDRMFVPADDAFFLRVADDGMVDRGVQSGDLVLVNPMGRAHDGDAVVARVGPDVMVRLLSHRGAQLLLTPASPGQSEVVVGPLDDFAIVGTVAAVISQWQGHQASGIGHQQPGTDPDMPAPDA